MGHLDGLLLCLLPTLPQDGRVLGVQKIGEGAGGFPADLAPNDQLGRAVACLGDLDGDGVVDVAIGAQGDDTGGANRGAVYIVFLTDQGTVKAVRKVASGVGGFPDILSNGDQFGRAVAAAGDVDGDGVVDLAVGANLDDDGGDGKGAVWVLFMAPDGSVKAHQKISASAGGLVGPLDVRDEFGRSVAGIGDLDLDGTSDLAVGASYDDDGGQNRGAVYVLFLRPDGTVRAESKISSTSGGFAGALDDFDYFGHGLGSPGDLNGDGTVELLVGAVLDDDAAFNAGAVWLLFLARDGTVQSHRKISTATGFGGHLDERDQFGVSVAGIGDIDANGAPDIAVGAVKDDDGGGGKGAVWIVFLDAGGGVVGHSKISDTQGGFSGYLDPFDWFGSAVAPLGDLDGDGRPDLVAGARYDDDGGLESGAVYVLFLDGPPGTPGFVVPYGSTVNPPGSTVLLQGRPAPGTSVVFGVQGLSGTAPGAKAWILAGLAPAAVVVADGGLAGGAGELLVDLDVVVALESGEAWTGPDTARVALSVPPDPGLLGVVVYVQGALHDPLGPWLGLASGLELHLGR